MSTKYLALYLESPMQSWGYISKFELRRTLDFPTRSGILGLLGAASGIDRDDIEQASALNEAVGINVYSYSNPSRMTDYHTIGGGYDSKKNPKDKLRVCTMSDGKEGDTVVTRRDYLQNAKYGVVVSGNHNVIEKLSKHVQNPVWCMFLGRKNCIPSARVFEGVFESEDLAITALNGVVGRPYVKSIVEVGFDDHTDVLMDVPYKTKWNKRQFRSRFVKITMHV